MQFTFELHLICLWLLCGHVLGQDVRPEFPEDFPITTPETVTELPTTTLLATTTTEANETPTVAATTTEAVITTTAEASTVTATTNKVAKETVASTTEQLPTIPSTPEVIPTWPPAVPYPYPTYPPATRPPHFTPAYHWLWDLYESEEVARCYLKDQVERNQFRWGCGYSKSMSIISCYRCCFYGNSRFAGCSKLHSGRCSIQSAAWQI